MLSPLALPGGIRHQTMSFASEILYLPTPPHLSTSSPWLSHHFRRAKMSEMSASNTLEKSCVVPFSASASHLFMKLSSFRSSFFCSSCTFACLTFSMASLMSSPQFMGFSPFKFWLFILYHIINIKSIFSNTRYAQYHIIYSIERTFIYILYFSFLLYVVCKYL